MEERKKKKQRKRILYKRTAVVILLLLLLTGLPKLLKAENGGGGEKESQITGLNVVESGSNKSRSSGVASRTAKALDENNPMYWMGQRTGGDKNRAMVWFGNYWQDSGGTNKSPILWQVLRSDGQGNYGGGVTLLSEYVLNSVWFDQNNAVQNQHWYNTDASIGSSDLRAWMNGAGTGAMNPDVGSRSSSSAYPYNAAGGGAGNKKGSFYANAFNDTEKGLIASTNIAGESGYGGVTGGSTSDKVFTLSSANVFDDSTYFSDNADRACKPTSFAVNSSNNVTDTGISVISGSSHWWLRTPHTVWSGVAKTCWDGTWWTDLPSTKDIGARPALNLDPTEARLCPGTASGGVMNQSNGWKKVASRAPGSADDADFSWMRVVPISRLGFVGLEMELLRPVDESRILLRFSGVKEGWFATVLLVNTTTGEKWIYTEDMRFLPTGMLLHLPDGITRDTEGCRMYAWMESIPSKVVSGTVAVGDLKDLPTTLSITKQPSALAGKTGENVEMQVSADKAVSYDWYITAATTATGGTKVATTDTNSYSYKLTDADNGKRYYCIVGNSISETITSNAAAITVYYPPEIKTNPSNVSVKQGAQATFSVAGQGGNPTDYRYQWQYRTSSSGTWTNVSTTQGSGGTTASFKTVAATTSMNGWQFRCYIGNGQYAAASGTGAESSAATLTVCYPPTVKTHPAGQTQTVGSNATFTAAGQGGNPAALTYLWQYRTGSSGTWTNVTSVVGTGETTVALTVPVTAAKNGYQFRCYIGNSQYNGTAGAVTNAASLTAQYQVTYSQNYTGAPVNTNAKIKVGGQVTLPSYSRSSYEFQGWATTKDAVTANAGKGGAAYTPTDNITLYAVWKQYTKPILDSTLPKDSKISPGKNTTFTTGITTAGYPASYTYQWYYKDGSNTEKTISGATGSSYSLTNVQASLSGYKYYCKITHASTGTTQSTREAVLTVYNTPPAPEIQYIGGINPFPWSNSEEGQAFIPTKGTEAVGGTTLQYQVSGGVWKNYTGTKVVTIGAGGSIAETDSASGENSRIVVKTEGENTVKIRAINTSDNSLVSSEVSVTARLDYTAPTGKLNDGKGTIWDQLQNLITFGKYYKENVVFTISDIKDEPAAGVTAASGIKKTSYYINEAKTAAEETELKSITADNIAQKSASWSWQDYTSGSFTVSPDKKFVVYVKVEDNAGNLHFIGSDGLTADATAPTAEITQDPAGWTNQDVTLTTTASDTVSQLAESAYSYDGGTTYVSSNTNTYSSNGETSIKVKDKAGNILTKAYTISSIDKQKPMISDSTDIQVSPEWVTGSGAKATVSLSAAAVEDQEVSGDTTENKGKSGIEGVYLIKADNKDEIAPALEAIIGKLTANGEGDKKVYSLEMTAPSETTSYYLRAKDHAGNWSSASEAHKATVQVDAEKLAVGKAAAEPKEWTNGTITVTASEMTVGLSGLDKVYLFKNSSETNQSAGYEMTKSADGTSYTYTIPSAELIKADIEGEKTWYIRVYNKAGAVSDPTAVTTKYDKTQAELSAVQEPDKAEDGNLLYAKEKKIKIKAKDGLSGLEKITFCKKNTAGGTQPEEAVLWPKSGSDESGENVDTAGTTGEVMTAKESIQENGAYVIRAYDTAGNMTETEAQVSGIDRTAPDITGFTKYTKETDSGKKMIVTFKVKDTESGISKVVYGTGSSLEMSSAKEAAAGDIDGNKDAGEGYLWYHFQTSMQEAEENYYVRAEDKAGNQSETVAAYEAENLLDATLPAKMMFAVIPELGGEKDSRLLSPDYQIKNNNDRAQLEVGLSGFTPARGGSILLTGGEAEKANEINLKAGKGSGAFSGLTEAKSLYGLSQGTAGELSFGTLAQAGMEGAAGVFRYTGSVFDYQRNGSIRQEKILRAQYTAKFHFSISLPKN